jgi:hypothetical protein
MSPKTHSKSGQKNCYRRHPISARGSNKKVTVTRRTCFWLPRRRNANDSNTLIKVTAVTFRPTSEVALAILRGSKVTYYLPRGSAVTGSTLPTSPRWQSRPAVGSLERDGRQLLAVWGAQAQAFGWTAREWPASSAGATSGQLFAIVALRHHAADLAAPRSPGDRVDGGGGGHALSSGATLTYRRQNEPTPGPQLALDDMGPTI